MSRSVLIQDASARKELENVDRNVSPIALAVYMGTVAAPYLSRRARERFRSGGDGASGKWPALSPATVEIRKNLGFTPGTGPGQINVRSGRMRDMLLKPNVFIANDGLGTTLEWPHRDPGNAKKRFAQAAGKGRGGIARHVIAWDEQDLAFLLAAMEEFALTGKASSR